VITAIGYEVEKVFERLSAFPGARLSHAQLTTFDPTLETNPASGLFVQVRGTADKSVLFLVKKN